MGASWRASTRHRVRATDERAIADGARSVVSLSASVCVCVCVHVSGNRLNSPANTRARKSLGPPGLAGPGWLLRARLEMQRRCVAIAGVGLRLRRRATSTSSALPSHSDADRHRVSHHVTRFRAAQSTTPEQSGAEQPWLGRPVLRPCATRHPHPSAPWAFGPTRPEPPARCAEHRALNKDADRHSLGAPSSISNHSHHTLGGSSAHGSVAGPAPARVHCHRARISHAHVHPHTRTRPRQALRTCPAQLSIFSLPTCASRALHAAVGLRAPDYVCTLTRIASASLRRVALERVPAGLAVFARLLLRPVAHFSWLGAE